MRLDPWETPYQLITKKNGAVFVRSCGPDGEEDNEDDLIRSVRDKFGRFR